MKYTPLSRNPCPAFNLLPLPTTLHCGAENDKIIISHACCYPAEGNTNKSDIAVVLFELHLALR